MCYYEQKDKGRSTLFNNEYKVILSCCNTDFTRLGGRDNKTEGKKGCLFLDRNYVIS